MFQGKKTSSKLGKGLVLLVLFFAFLIRVPETQAAASTLHFQGKITNSNGTNLTTGSPACVTGGADTCDIRFSIYSDSGATTLLWRETHNNVELGNYDGIFSLELNSICQGWTSTGSPNCTISNGGVTFTGNLYYVIEFDPTGAGTFVSPERFPASGTAEMSSVSQSLSLVGANGESITNNTNGVVQIANNTNSNTLSADLTGSSTLSKFLNYSDGTNTVSFLSGSQNPQSVATNAGTGSVFLNTSNGNVYVKQDSGSSTNWSLLGTSSTNYWQLNAGVVSPAISSNSLAVGGTATASAKFLVDGTNGNTTISGGKLAIWDATQSNTAYLKISNATNFVSSGSLNGADIVINSQSSGAVQGLRSGIVIDGTSTPSTARGLRGEFTYNSSGTTGGSEVYTAVSGNSTTNSGDITGVLTAGNFLSTANSGSTVSQLNGSRSFVITNSGSTQNNINGVYSSVTHGGVSTADLSGFNGLVSVSGNTGGINGQKLIIQNSAITGGIFGTNTYLENQVGGTANYAFGQNYQIYNNGTLNNPGDNALVFIGSTGGNNGTINGNFIGMGTDFQNGFGAVVNGDVIGHRVMITNNGFAQNIYGSKYVLAGDGAASASAYGIYMSPISAGNQNNYGVYIATVSGAVSQNYGLLVEAQTKSKFGGKVEFASSTTSNATLNLSDSSGVNPSSSINGDLWWNGTNLNFRAGGTTVDLLGWQNPGAYWQLNAGVLSPGISSNSLAVGGTATNSALFNVDGTTGNVMIGSGTQEGQLSLRGDYASTTSVGQTIRGMNGGGAVLSLVQDGVYSWGLGMDSGDTAFRILNNRNAGFGGSGAALLIDTVSNMTLGGASPDTRLDLENDFTSVNGVGQVIHGTNNGGSMMSFIQDGINAWGIGMEAGVNGFSIINARETGVVGTRALIIDSSNNMALGGTTADTRLDLEGDFTSVNGVGQVIHGTTSGGSVLSLVQDGVNSWGLGMNAADGNFTITNGRETGVAGTASLTIDTSGNVGIGEVAPSFRLDVADTQASSHVARINNLDTGSSASGLQVQLGFTGLGDTTNRFITFLNGNADVQGRIESDGAAGVTYATGASDFAEWFAKQNPDEVMPIGSVVCLGNGGVRLCNSSDAGHILGTVSKAPAFLGGKPGPGKVIVALSGQVPLKVTSQGGPIAIGDRVTVASLTGSGQKLGTAGYAIGRALTSYDGVSGEATIQIFVHPEYFNPDSSLALATPTPAASPTPTATPEPSPAPSILPADGSTLTASTIKVDGLTISGHSIDLNEGTFSLLSGKFTIAQNGNVTITGDLMVNGAITAKSIIAEQLNLMVGNTPVASISAQGARFNTVLSAESDLEVKGNLKASGRNVGEVRIPAGQQEFRYNFSTPFAHNVYLQLTAVDGEENVYKLKDVNEAGFTVMLSKGYDTERVFNWFAVER